MARITDFTTSAVVILLVLLAIGIYTESFAVFNLDKILNYTFWSNSVKDYLLSLLVFVISITILRFFKYKVVTRLKKLAAKSKSQIDDFIIEVIDDVGWPLYILLALYMSLKFIQLPEMIGLAVYYALILVVVYYVIKSLQRIIDFSAQKMIRERKAKEKEVDTTIIDLFKKLLKGILWLAAFLFIISSLGYDISSVVVGLGVGGIVIGFALQNILGDVFAAFSIYFDKPFEKGDFIIIGDDLGVVDKIGIRSTRIKHLKGHELVVSNRELTSARINNYKKMQKRRVSFNFGVTYETSSKKVKKIPEIVKKIIDRVDLAEPDRVHFKEFGDFALTFEVVYYTATSDYNKYMDIRQQINLEMKKQFEKEGIEFAFPTQTIFLSKQK